MRSSLMDFGNRIGVFLAKPKNYFAVSIATAGVFGWVLFDIRGRALYPVHRVMIEADQSLLVGTLVFALLTWLTGRGMAEAPRLDLGRRIVLAAATEQQRVEQERHGISFESSSYPMWIYDLRTLQIVDVNEAATRIYGYGRHEFLGLTIAALRPAEDLSLLLRAVADARHGFTGSERHRHRRKDGSLMEVAVYGYSFVAGERKLEVVLVEPKLEKGNVSNSSSTQRSPLPEALEGASFGYARSSLKEGRIVSVNESMLRLLGYSSVAELPAPDRLYRHRTDRHRLLRELMNDRPMVDHLATFVRKDGSEVDVTITSTLERDEVGEPSLIECYVRAVDTLQHTTLNSSYTETKVLDRSSQIS